jgi:diguanylate cyclase (GGDEF)-like protein
MYVLVAAGAAVAAPALALAFIAGRRRAERIADARIERAVADASGRSTSLVGELTEALERARAESRRERMLADLSATLDLDKVLARTLDAAAGLPNVDAALVSLPAGAGGEPTVATHGLSAEQDGREGAARDGRAASEGDDGVLRGGVGVLLAVDGATGGRLAVFTRRPGGALGRDMLRDLKEIAERAAPAIEQARRFQDARRLADLDSLTGLHNRRYFHETLAREVARAARYGRTLALLILDVDDFKAVNDRIGHLAGDAVLAAVAERIGDVVRSADVACRVGGDEFGVILPESSLADADRLYRRIQSAISSERIAEAGRVHVSGGVAELRGGDDGASLFERSDQALYRAKNSGKGRVASTR